MIATLSGLVAEKLGELVIVDVGGVGYGVLMPLEDYGNLNIGSPVKLYIYEHIREVSHDLYGFTHLDTKRLFEQLLDVNGIGPKGALSVLGIGSVEDVRQAIASGDTKFIQAAQGVGKKVAERVVVELKDKVGLVSTVNSESFFAGTASANVDEAVQALVSLGYTLPDAVTALVDVDPSKSTEERIKLALKARA
ncbi:MAG: Holliday junction helicase, subunit [Candidatus Saccharibacteria bacterium]|nr:Holliday junction helicase, subunit [Candidatus Saccharibacteria bacterium]